jgi:hypothetical protein
LYSLCSQHPNDSQKAVVDLFPNYCLFLRMI